MPIKEPYHHPDRAEMAARERKCPANAHACKVTQESLRVGRSLAGRQVFRPAEHVPPLGIKADGKANLKLRRWNRADQREAGSIPRAGGSDKHRGIENDAQASERMSGD